MPKDDLRLLPVRAVPATPTICSPSMKTTAVDMVAAVVAMVPAVSSPFSLLSLCWRCWA